MKFEPKRKEKAMTKSSSRKGRARTTGKKSTGKAKPKAAKQTATKAKTPKAPRKKGRMSGLDAAAKVIKEAKQPLHCREVVDRMIAKGLWTTSGKTPAATIYAAMLREIQRKGDASRFVRTERGVFALKS